MSPELETLLRDAVNAQIALWEAEVKIERLLGGDEIPGLDGAIELFAVCADQDDAMDVLPLYQDMVATGIIKTGVLS
jgi:hypothetical protein